MNQKRLAWAAYKSVALSALNLPKTGGLTSIRNAKILFPNWEERHMRLIGCEKLAWAKSIGIDVDKWVLSWAAEVRSAHWKHPSDVCEQFPNACRKSDSLFLFPVSKCSLAIQVLIAFPQGIALIQDFKSSEDTNEH